MKEDINTLREEFRKEYYQTPNLTYFETDYTTRADIEKIADWWLNKFNQKLEEIEREIEKEKEDIENIIEPCKDSAEDKNRVLDLALQIIKNKKN